MQIMAYWLGLRELNLYSLERTRKRHAVIYIWKILTGLSPSLGMDSYINPRNGRHCILTKISTASKQRRNSCSNPGLKGPQLLNIPQRSRRDLHGDDVDVFKKLPGKYRMNLRYSRRRSEDQFSQTLYFIINNGRNGNYNLSLYTTNTLALGLNQ